MRQEYIKKYKRDDPFFNLRAVHFKGSWSIISKVDQARVYFMYLGLDEDKEDNFLSINKIKNESIINNK
ncbi:hypothetical protein ACFY5J_04640 [Peribacillus butanolivorans]|uniref:hypothetical protein n=1 Tax=Peribacillus butanolivorans TaxID=421767 RepID=UPI0036795E6B